MVRTMLATVDNANGQQVIRIMKNKETSLTSEEAKLYLRKLLESQKGLCALTKIPFEVPSNVSNPELACSLDRIDSNAHYELGNLQIVCKFVNRWKSDTPDGEFRGLIELVKNQSD